MNHIDLFKDAYKRLSNPIPAFASIRGESMEQAEKLGLPDFKNESWKYTSLGKFFKFDELTTEKKETRKIPPTQEWSGKSNIVFYNGVFQRDLSTLNEQDGLTIYSLNDDLNDELSKMVDRTVRDQLEQNEFFQAINLALGTGGIIIKLDQKAQASSPIKISHLVDSENSVRMSTIKNILWLDPMSKAVVLEEFLSTDSSEGFLNSSTHAFLGPGAQLEYTSWQNLSDQCLLVQNLTYQLKRDARLQATLGHLGSRMSRSQVQARFVGTGANAQINGVSVLNNDQHVDVVSDLVHSVEHTESGQLFKGILADRSRNIFTGKQYIAEDAQKVNSSQLSKNLLLSDKAEADSRPQLEVNADDVKANHGAAIGQLNPDELFYLMSRALSRQEAFSMLASGYAYEVLDRIANDSVKSYLRPQLRKKLKQISEGQWGF